MDYFFDYTSQITNQFIDPKKRVFLFYILISILIAATWFMINKKLSLKKTLIKIFDKGCRTRSKCTTPAAQFALWFGMSG